MSSQSNENCTIEVTERSAKQWIKKYREAIFFSLVAGMSVLSGFGTTLMLAKRKDSAMFDKGMSSAGLSESGTYLAVRALGRGSLYAVGGVSVFCFIVWKLTGVNSVKEFEAKVQSSVKSLKRSNIETRPRGRSEFASIRELVNYLIEEDQQTKTENNKKQLTVDKKSEQS